MADAGVVDDDMGVTHEEAGGGFRRNARTLMWAGCFLSLLFFFTLLKIPDERIGAYMMYMIRQQLDPLGMTLTSPKPPHLSLIFGPSVSLEDVSLTLPPSGTSPPTVVHVDKVSVSPSFLPLLTRKVGGTVSLKIGDGKATVKAALKTVGRDTTADVSFDLSSIDIGKLGLLPALANLHGTAVASGSGSLSGNFQVPNTLVGNVDLELSKISLDPQTIVIVTLPEVSISTAKVSLVFDKSGKMAIKTFKIGKGDPDDLRGTATGEISLARTWDTSVLKVQTNFSISPKVMKALVLADALLGPGKQSDGSYSFDLNGPIGSMNAAPVTGPPK